MLQSDKLKKRAEKAKKKRATFGEDIELEEFIQEDGGEHYVIAFLSELPEEYKESVLRVGVVPEAEDRTGSLMQIDQSGVYSLCNSETT